MLRFSVCFRCLGVRLQGVGPLNFLGSGCEGLGSRCYG